MGVRLVPLQLEPLQRGAQLAAAVPVGDVLRDLVGEVREFLADAGFGLIPDDAAV